MLRPRLRFAAQPQTLTNGTASMHFGRCINDPFYFYCVLLVHLNSAGAYRSLQTRDRAYQSGRCNVCWRRALDADDLRRPRKSHCQWDKSA